MASTVATMVALVSALRVFLPAEARDQVVVSADGSTQMMNGRSKRPLVRAQPGVDKSYYVVDAAGGGGFQLFSRERPVVDLSGGSAPSVLSLLGRIQNERSASRQEAFARALRGDGRLRSCAVVGSGQSLMNARLGEEIDAHDWVWRMNRDNTSHKIAAITGMRSDIIMAGHLWWPTWCLPKCWNKEENRDAVLIGNFDGARKPAPAYNLTGMLTDLITERIAKLNERSPEVKRRPEEDYGHDIYAFADDKINDLGRRLTLAAGAPLHCNRNFSKDGLKENSAGFVSFLLATLMCDEVDVYGYGPDDASKGNYSFSDHGGFFACNHAFKEEHDVMRSWSAMSAAGRCPAHPREHIMPGGAAEERLGQDVLKEVRSFWAPDHDAHDAELLDRACQASRVTFHE